MMLACGQYVPAGTVLGGSTVEVSLTTLEELADASTLRLYAFDSLMRQHTDPMDITGGQMRGVDYTTMLESAEARMAVSDTLAQLGTVDPSGLSDADERLAYWLNLYNAWTIQAVLDELEADPDWGGVSEPKNTFDLFSREMVQVGGLSLSLNMLEHGVIRGHAESVESYTDSDEVQSQVWTWHAETWPDGQIDARIHMGLNCASQGCPDILDGAFQGDMVWDQLDEAAVGYVSHPGKGAGPNGISQLFNWFSGDFDGSHGGAQGFVSAYREGGDSDVDYSTSLDYSWELNRAN